ncbi:uncharacterized protein LOC134272791 [Saccostrea cucullata]|uniref:uncharacterized protein LOC134272791 n=1 Tax=Saccostrea cuccullata TaxID=36930 RepID=UPI002ED37EF4
MTVWLAGKKDVKREKQMNMCTAAVILNYLLTLCLGCQEAFYDIPGRRFHITKAYDSSSPGTLSHCRQRCIEDKNCVAFMHYNTTDLCALSNLTGLKFGYLCDYCFSALKVGTCSTPTPATTNTPSTPTPESPCTCTCMETNDTLMRSIEERRTSLRLNKTELSSTKRKLSSAEDQRVSAKRLGYVGILVITISVGLFVFIDFLNLITLKKRIKCLKRGCCK